MNNKYLFQNFLLTSGSYTSRIYLKFQNIKHADNNSPFISKSPKIYTANHPSTLDPFYLMGIIKEPVHVFIADPVFKISGLGQFLKYAGHVNVVKEEGYKSVERGIKLLKSGRSILIFPEGNISPTNYEIVKFRTGAVRMALSAKVPIVPIGIYVNPEKIERKYMKIEGKYIEGHWYKNDIYVTTYGNPICFNGNVMDRESVLNRGEILRKRIEELSNQSENKYQEIIRNNKYLRNTLEKKVFSFVISKFRYAFRYLN